MSTIRIRTKPQGSKTLLRIMIEHPMETGRRKDDATGLLVPAHYITELCIEHNGAPVIQSTLTTAVSRNPYFSFRLGKTRVGDRLRISWKDNRGGGDTLESLIDHDSSS